MAVRPERDSLVGTLVAGRYQVLSKLGQGGMGAVYLAEQQPLQRRVALKVLGDKSDAEARERFVREARAASRLHHPNIATVYDFGDTEGGPFLAMEFIDGPTLRELMSSDIAVPWKRAHALAAQIARGLAAAHREGIVHRDIKPENLIIEVDGVQEQVKILDFGIANLVNNSSPSLTQTGLVMGTAGYVSPEQLEGTSNDVRSDLYSLGILLYEMLAGRHPFNAKTATALVIAHATEIPTPLVECVDDVPVALCRLVDRLLAKNPADRPADAGELVHALHAALGSRDFTGIQSGTGSGWHGVLEDQAPKGRVTLVFTDIEGSTAIWEREPRAMRLALDAHNAIMRDAIETHRGYEVKTQGDAFMVAFASEADAVKWCLTVQRKLREQEWPGEIARGKDERSSDDSHTRVPGLRVRMGVHLGEPDCRRGPVTGRMDYFGPVVNRAARIEGAAHGGQILVSEAVVRCMATSIANLDAHFRPRGDHALKGLDAPEPLIEVVDNRVEHQQFPAPRTAATSERSNLIADHTVFVGRQRELAQIAEHLASGARLVTLLGPGGTGKTRLARVAALQQTERPGGPAQVWFCDLSAVNKGTALVATIAGVLSVPLSGGDVLSDGIARVGRSLAGRGQVLLVLDNLEQVLDAASGPLATWMQASPQLQVLATSREALNVDGELRMELDPLDSDMGVELFMARVKELGRPPTDERDTVQKVVEALDGIPLAIELAASRIGLMNPSQILERLNHRFDLLRGNRRGVGARQATLRGAIDWSWDLLSEVERDAFAQLAVFEGGFSIEAAEEVVDLTSHAETPYVLDVVQALKDKSLLRSETAHSSEFRLNMLQSIQDYAASKLAAFPDGAQAAQARHATYFIREGKRNAKATTTERKPSAMAWLAGNRQNLFAVCRRFQTTSPLEAVAAALALEPLLAERDPTDPHRRHLAAATEWARASGDDVITAEVLLLRANLEQERGDGELALAHVEEARALLGDERAPVLRATALARQARILFRLGRLDKGAAALDAAEPLAREHGAHSLVARILSQRGMHALSALDEEQNYLADALQLARRSGDTEMEARILGNLGVDHMVRGRLEDAEAAMLEALASHRANQTRGLEGLTMGNLGLVLLALEDVPQSETWLRGAIAIHREQGNELLEGADRSNLARTLLEDSRIHEAIENAEQGRILIERNSGARERLFCLCTLAVSYACLDRIEEAQLALEAATQTVSTLSETMQQSIVDSTQAHIDLARARVRGDDMSDQRVVAAREFLTGRLAPGARLFLPVKTLVRYAESYPGSPPILDADSPR